MAVLTWLLFAVAFFPMSCVILLLRSFVVFFLVFVVVSYGFCFFRDLLKAILSILVGCRLWFAARLRRINRKDNEWMAD